MSALPKAVRESAALADKMQQDLGQPKPPVAPAPHDPPANDPPATPEPVPPAAPVDPAALIATAPTAEQDKDITYWRNRFAALQGKYNAEVPLLSRQLRDLKAQVSELLKKPAATANPANPQPLAGELFTDKEREQFGVDTLGVIQRAAETIAARIVDERVRPISDQVQDTTQERFYKRLADLAPDWEAINQDPAWLEWLGQIDPLSEHDDPRQIALNKHVDSYRADKVAAYIDAFRVAMNRPKPGADVKAPKPPKTPTVTPRNTPPAAPSPLGAGDIITRAQITQFYEDVRKGMYRGREAEAKAFEQRIFAANAAGQTR